MATEIMIYRTCEKCNGTGRYKPHHSAIEQECSSCGGSGQLLYATMPDLGGLLDDINDKVNDIKEKVDEIMAVVDAL